MTLKIGQDIDYCVELLNQNDLVAIPTETVYGLAGNGLNKEAIAKIFEVKKRPFFDPLILHTDTLSKVTDFVKDIPEVAQQLANNIWPGPLTLVLNKKDSVPDLATSGLPTVGVRIPAHPLSLKLLSQISYPLAAPSANPFKYISPTCAQHVKDQLGNQLKYILDGGPCSIGLESTIVGFENDFPVIYRLGGLEIERIEQLIGPVKLLTNADHNPSAPGMLKLHYAPTKKLVVDDLKNIGKYTHAKVGLITFKDHNDQVQVCNVLSRKGDLNEAANNLFAVMRALDKEDVDIIVAERFPEYGLGRAINDRLHRASIKK